MLGLDAGDERAAPPAARPPTVLPAGCRPAAVAVLVARRLAHDPRRPRLAEVAVGFSNGLGQFELKATAPVGRVEGKGPVDCKAHRIVAFSADVIPPGERSASVCPATPGPGPTACARREFAE